MSKDKLREHRILHDKNIYKGLIILAFPLMINNFIKTIHDIIDMYFVGRIEDYSIESIASIQLTFPVVFAYISLGIGLSVAGTALISQLIGSNQMDVARKYSAQLVMFSLIVGVILNVISYTFSPAIMEAMGATGYILENSSKYLQIRSFELPVLFVFFAFTAIRQSSGDTVTPMIYGSFMIVVNIVLSWYLIQIIGLGVSGAAYATLIANLVGAPLIFYSLMNAKTGITLRKECFKLDKEIITEITITAIPAAFGQALTAVGFGFMNGIIFSYGAITVAAFGIGNRISSLILYPVMAIGGVTAAFIGQNIGNNNVSRAKEVFKKSLILSVGIMAFGSIVFMNIRVYMVDIFLDDPQAVSLATEYMFYLLLGLPLMAVFQSFLGVFNGSGNTIYTFLLSVTRLWILRIPLLVSFKNFTDLGSSGVWYAMLISNVTIMFIGYFFYKKVDFLPKVKMKKKDLILEKA